MTDQRVKCFKSLQMESGEGCGEDLCLSFWIINELLGSILPTGGNEHGISITHHYWPGRLAAGPAPRSAGRSAGQTAKRLSPVWWTPLERTHKYREAHTNMGHCKRIISASSKTSKRVLITSYSWLGGFSRHNTGSRTALVLPRRVKYQS